MKPQKEIEESYDCTVKVIIIGDSGVGKTNILLRYIDNEFRLSYMATIGVDFKTKIVTVEDKRFKLQIWDTAGQQRFKNMNNTYYKGAIGIILVYAINDLNSFNNVGSDSINLENWMRQIHENAAVGVKKILVANKTDLQQERKVSFEAGQNAAHKYDLDFFEVSAKHATNIEQAFMKLAKLIKPLVDEQQNEQTLVSKNNKLRKSLEYPNVKQETKGGCSC